MVGDFSLVLFDDFLRCGLSLSLFLRVLKVATACNCVVPTPESTAQRVDSKLSCFKAEVCALLART